MLGTSEIDLDNPDFDEMEQDIAEFASVPSVNEVLLQGTDLKNYYQQIAEELREAEAEAVKDYIEQRDDSQSLHQIISTCDEQLASIEELLINFKNSLSHLSTDICTLQAKSQTITTQLGNRKNLESEFGAFTKNIALTNGFINEIMHGEIDQNYVDALLELNEKLQFIKKKEIMMTQSAQETKVPLDTLRVIASVNVRNWIVDRINELKECYGTEQANIQQRMLKCKFLIEFLKTNSPELEQAVREYYTHIMAKIYKENFHMLTNRIKRQMYSTPLSNETLVPVIQTGFWKSKKAITNEPTQFFTLGDRERLLTPLIAPPQQFGDGNYHVEAFIKSLYQILIDVTTCEHTFASEFFMNDSVTFNIFSETFMFLESFMKELMNKVNDPVCVALLLRFAYAFTQEMQRRKINKVDSHLRNLTQFLQNRFKDIIKTNVTALQQIDPHLFTENKETCHFSNSMTQRFSEFALSMFKVMDKSNIPLFYEETSKVMQSADDLLNKIGQIIGEETQKKEMKHVFLINNYYVILDKLSIAQTLSNSGSTSSFYASAPVSASASMNNLNQPIASDIVRFFTEKNETCQREFIDIVIEQQFPELMGTIKRAYASSYDQKERPINIDIGEKELKSISVDFKDHHTAKAVQIIDSQLQRFDNINNRNSLGLNIIQRIAFLWTRFELLVIVNSPNNSLPSWWSQMTTANKLIEDFRPITKKLAPM